MRAIWSIPLLAACSFTHGDPPLRGDGGGSADASDAAMTDAAIDAAIDGTPSTLRAKTITITATVGGTLGDFPLWFTVTDPDIGARAQLDGKDIFFTTTAGVPLDYQIQRWTKSSGRLDAWVRVPSLATNTQIQVRYGDLAVAAAPDAPGTFAGYAAVWHLEDTLNNTMVVDATGQRNGTASMLQPADQKVAQLGGGIEFSGGSDQISFTNPIAGSGAHTISLWVNQRTTTNNDAMVVLGNGDTNEARWFHSRYNGATIAVGFYTNDFANPNEDIQGDGWTLLHWVYEGANRMTRIYRDGALVAGPFQHANGVDTMGNTGLLGNAPSAFGTNMGLNAMLDEVRIIGIARSPEWIAAEALDQKTPTSFYSVGNEEIP
ncbi:MAG: DUF2341 domain-containing protein [Kofleriaceae bacterium]|nr:DUF2341 domain-containing protein [Kofleriaceae bacterium]